MIRLSPTAITLGPGDLLDSDKRQQQHRAIGKTAQSIAVAATFKGIVEQKSIKICQNFGQSSFFKVECLNSGNIASSSSSTNEEPQRPAPYSTATNEEFKEHSLVDDSLSFGFNNFVEGTKTGIIEIQQSSPSKDDFHYGGFSESPTLCVTSDYFHGTSPFGTSIEMRPT